MSYATALRIAAARAKKADCERFIVCEAGEYDVCTEEDLDGFWLGARVVAVVDPYGLVTA